MRACLFCGGRPVTREHVVPEWTAKSLGVRRLTSTSLVDRKPVGTAWEAVGSFEVVAKVICKRCNEGWLSRHENRIQPYLEPILHGKREQLDEAGQEWVAAWIWKTFLVMDTMYEPRTFGPKDAERFFRYRVAPRRDAWVFIGRIKPSHHVSTGGRAITPIVTSVTGTTEGTVAVWTLKVGCFITQAIHVVRVPGGPTLPFVVRPDHFARRLPAIWPPHEQSHPSIPLEAAEFQNLALRLRAAGRFGWGKSRE